MYAALRQSPRSNVVGTTHPPSVLRKRSLRANLVPAQVGAGSQMLLRASNLQTNILCKPTRVGVRADDIGAKRLEEARIPRDGGF